MPPGQTLDWGGQTPRARATGGKETLINAEPGRSRRKALGLPSQGRHRPRSSLRVALGDAHQADIRAIHDWSARPTPPYSGGCFTEQGPSSPMACVLPSFLEAAAGETDRTLQQ